MIITKISDIIEVEPDDACIYREVVIMNKKMLYKIAIPVVIGICGFTADRFLPADQTSDLNKDAAEIVSVSDHLLPDSEPENHLSMLKSANEDGNVGKEEVPAVTEVPAEIVIQEQPLGQNCKETVTSGKENVPEATSMNKDTTQSQKPVQTEANNTDEEGIVHPTPSPVQPYDDGNVQTEADDITAPAKDNGSASKPLRTTESQTPQRNWIPAVYEDVWVVDVEAWTEEVPVYEEKEAAQCVICGKILYNQSEVYEHGMYSDCNPMQWKSYNYQVQTGTQTVNHKEIGHYEKRLVTEGHWE